MKKVSVTEVVYIDTKKIIGLLFKNDSSFCGDEK